MSPLKTKYSRLLVKYLDRVALLYVWSHPGSLAHLGTSQDFRIYLAR
jgi:hypothetical protein